MTPALMIIVGFVGLYFAFTTYRSLKLMPAGNEKMQEIAGLINSGTLIFLKKESQLLLIFIGAVFLILFMWFGFGTAISFVLGAICSLTASFFGMKAATIANVRTSQVATENNSLLALLTAFNGGSIMGLAVASLGIAGLGVLLIFFYASDLSIESASALVGFGMGASTVAFFARVGGGIYTKAADLGCYLVGNIEPRIPADDIRNPSVIADNVGDNVGNIAGMGADIFESYVGAMIACMVIATTMTFSGETSKQIIYMFTPFVMGIIGLATSLIAIKTMRSTKDYNPSSLRNSTFLAAALFLALMFIYMVYQGWANDVMGLWHWLSVVLGTLCGIGIGLIAEYFTSMKPVLNIVEASRMGPATNVIAGLSVGFMSCVAPLILIAVCMAIANWCGGEEDGMYCIALASVAMLSTVGISMSVYAYGPIADNAGGISEMADLNQDAKVITDKLDSIGNTTATIGKGFAIASAAFTSLALFSAYSQTINSKTKLLNLPDIDLSIVNPILIIGVLIGATLPCVISALTMSSVGRAAAELLAETRRQFREIAGLSEGKDGIRADVDRCIENTTNIALKEMRLPGLIAILSPIVVGKLFGPAALGGMLLGATVIGVVLAFFMANAGGAWDNAKKFIEQGLIEGEMRGSNVHRAALVGDAVGDPFKDTAGPSINILIKLMSIVALLIAPTLI